MAKRRQKVIRLNYLTNQPNKSMAAISLFSGPAEARMSLNNKQFIAINETSGISIAPGMGKQVNMQLLPQNMRYGGMLMDLPFPLSIIPTTPFTPFPKQFFVPPLLGLTPTLVQLGLLLALFPA